MGEFKSRKLKRLKGYDYSSNGYYYVTVCTQDHKEIFGGIENDDMHINQYGKIIANIWVQIPRHFKNIELDKFIIMPNHIHGIIIINNPVEAGHALPSNKNTKSKNLSIIIGSFKSAATKQINRLNQIAFKWQRSFYDYHIRTEESLKNIRQYVMNNPVNWDTDENNIKNHKLEGQACLAPTGHF